MTDLFPETVAAPASPPRRWVPEFLVDEVTPPPRETPDAWLPTECISGRMIVADDLEDGPAVALTIGDTMEFAWVVDHGTIVFEIAADGTFTTDRPIPPEANSFLEIGDTDTLGEAAEVFARNWAESAFGYGEETSMTVDVYVYVYQWGNNHVTFLLVETDGRAKFEEVVDV